MSSKLLLTPRNLMIPSASTSSHHNHNHLQHILLLPIRCNSNFPFPHKKKHFFPPSNNFFSPKTIASIGTGNSLLVLPPCYLSLPPLHYLYQALPPGNEDATIIKQEEEEDDEEQVLLKKQARDVVSDILREYGVSMEESTLIASTSPKYVAMLVDSVCDLDELSLWKSWQKQPEAEPKEAEAVEKGFATPPLQLSFKQKVYLIAKKKGDMGMIPFLESSGLTISSATNVARYLSSLSLPNLIHKVKYVKEIFFSHSDDEGLIGKNARRMMMHLSIPIDEDLQQTLSFFEKIQARRGGLDLLGSKDASFQYLVESFPRLLLLSLESHMKAMVHFLESIGIPQGSMRYILLLFPPIIFYDIEKDIKQRIQAFEKVGAGDKKFGRMFLKYPWILSTSIQKNYEEILYFFDMEKVPQVSVDRAIRSWPHILGCSVSKLKLRVEQFGELGVRNKRLGQVVATSPQLLLQKPQEFLQVVSFLKDMGLDEETIGRILGRCPEIFAANIKKTLEKKIEFLASIGVSNYDLPQIIKKYPELFVCDVNKALLPRMRYLMKIGLSKRDIRFMVRRFSPLLGYSIEEVLRPKLEFLVKTMEKPVRDVVDYPRYFSYSLEKKIRPRYWVLKGRNVECSLREMLGKNDEEFAAEFMSVGRMLVPPPLE